MTSMTSTWEGTFSENAFFDYILPRKNLKIDRAIIHPEYNENNDKNDIALLKLKNPLDLAEYTPVCLPERNQMFVGETAWVYGWGLFENGNPDLSPVLRQTTQQVIASDKCEQIWQFLNIFPSQLCALAQDQDSCTGDSGGPLTVEVAGRHTLIGTVSFGFDVCATVDIFSKITFLPMIIFSQRFPAVYANVPNIRDWIDETMENNGGGNVCPTDNAINFPNP